MCQSFDVLIVGGGHGGAQAAVALRQNHFAGTIAIVSEETELPYERPPFSKNYLSRAVTFERILIRRGSFWIDKQISMLLGRRVVSVDSERRRVTTSDGGEISYGKLIWAAGGHARRLTCSGHDLAGVHTIRSRADVDQLMTELDETNRAVVIGGGYIGLEAAAVLAKLGKRVTLLEALPRVLARVAGEPLSRFYEDEHRAHGVDVRLSAAVSCDRCPGGCSSGGLGLATRPCRTSPRSRRRAFAMGRKLRRERPVTGPKSLGIRCTNERQYVGCPCSSPTFEIV